MDEIVEIGNLTNGKESKKGGMKIGAYEQEKSLHAQK